MNRPCSAYEWVYHDEDAKGFLTLPDGREIVINFYDDGLEISGASIQIKPSDKEKGGIDVTFLAPTE